jgi:WD40 repeat protein
MEVGFSPRQFALSQHKNRHVVYLCEKVSLPDVDKAAVYRAKMKKREVKTYSGCHIYAFDLKTRSAPQKLVSMKFCLEMQVTPDGEYLVVRGRKSVKLVDLSDGKVVKYKHPHLIKCIAVHPKQHFVAFGNIRGEIMFLHCFGKPNAGVGVGTGSGTVGTRHVAIEKAVTSAQRWHQVAVQCLAFDAEGTYMYSGGRESVVVIWQLESGNRDFIPRLGAAILGLTLSPDQLLLAVRMSDNSIKFANTRSRASEGVVEGINAPRTSFRSRNILSWLAPCF